MNFEYYVYENEGYLNLEPESVVIVVIDLFQLNAA